MFDEEFAMLERFQYLTDQVFTFDDGAIIKVIHVKMRPNGCNVMYEASWNNGLPRRFVVHISEFLNTFEHLFPESSSK